MGSFQGGGSGKARDHLGRLRLAVIPDLKATTGHDFNIHHVTPGSTVYTHGSPSLARVHDQVRSDALSPNFHAVIAGAVSSRMVPYVAWFPLNLPGAFSAEGRRFDSCQGMS